MGHHRWDVDDVGTLHLEDLVAQGIQDLLIVGEHVGLFSEVSVHRRGSSRRGVGNPDSQILVPVALALHHVNILARAGIDDHKIALREREVTDLRHRRRLECAGDSAGLDDAVRMVLGMQGQPDFVDIDDALAMLDASLLDFSTLIGNDRLGWQCRCLFCYG